MVLTASFWNSEFRIPAFCWKSCWKSWKLRSLCDGTVKSLGGATAKIGTSSLACATNPVCAVGVRIWKKSRAVRTDRSSRVTGRRDLASRSTGRQGGVHCSSAVPEAAQRTGQARPDVLTAWKVLPPLGLKRRPPAWGCCCCCWNRTGAGIVLNLLGWPNRNWLGGGGGVGWGLGLWAVLVAVATAHRARRAISFCREQWAQNSTAHV